MTLVNESRSGSWGRRFVDGESEAGNALEEHAGAALAGVEQGADCGQAVAAVDGEEGLDAAVALGHDDVDAVAGGDEGAQEGRLEQGHVGGDDECEVVADESEGSLDAGEGPALTAAIVGNPPAQAGRRGGQLLAGPGDEDEVVGDGGEGVGGPVQEGAVRRRGRSPCRDRGGSRSRRPG